MENKKLDKGDWIRAISKQLMGMCTSGKRFGGVNDVYHDFIEISALMISITTNGHEYDKRSARFKELCSKYTLDEREVFTRCLIDLEKALIETKSDILGDLTNVIGRYNDKLGQFMTPSTVSDVMAGLIMGDGDDNAILDKGYYSVCDPACGTGGMLIASYWRHMAKDGKSPHEVFLYGTDIDPRMSMMCSIQLALIGSAAFIRCANSILDFEKPTNSSITDLWATNLYMKYRDLYNAPEPVEVKKRTFKAKVKP